MQANKLALITFFFLLVLNVSYGQQEKISRLSYPEILNIPVIYIIDGLKISKEKFIELKLPIYTLRKLTVDKKRSEVKIKSKLLIVHNEIKLDRKNKTLLSQINEEDITVIRFIERENAINEYGKKGRHGALIIKTKDLP